MATDAKKAVLDVVKGRYPDRILTVGKYKLNVHVDANLSPNDQYHWSERPNDEVIVVVINGNHPYFPGGPALSQYLELCAIDALTEFKVRNAIGKLDPDVFTATKDTLLRATNITKAD